jgi:hypothetical protein
MELNKENQHIVMQWNDVSYVADNGILHVSQKNVPQKSLQLTSNVYPMMLCMMCL